MVVVAIAPIVALSCTAAVEVLAVGGVGSGSVLGCY